MGYFIMECNFMSGTEIIKYYHAYGLMKAESDLIPNCPLIKIFKKTCFWKWSQVDPTIWLRYMNLNIEGCQNQ